MLFLIFPFLATVSCQSFNLTNYPEPNAVPSSNIEWIKSFLESRNGSIPNLPQRQGDQGSDWSKDKNKCNQANTWAFTFDDGPSEHTEVALAALAATNKTGLFFVTGSQALENPAILKKIADAGHEIGSHTWSHQSLTSLSTTQVVAELAWSLRLIKQITGKTPTFMRPPCKITIF